MGRRQVDAAEANLGKSCGEVGEVEALAEAELEHRVRRFGRPGRRDPLELAVEALGAEPAGADRQAASSLRANDACGRRASILVIGDHFAGAHAFGADLLDAEDPVELLQATAQVGRAGRALKRGGPGHAVAVADDREETLLAIVPCREAPRPAHSPLRFRIAALAMTTLDAPPGQDHCRCRARRRPPGGASADGRGGARRLRPYQGGAARGRRQHVPGRHRQRQGLGGDRHGRGQPGAGAACQGQPELLRQPRRDGARASSCRRPARC